MNTNSRVVFSVRDIATIGMMAAMLEAVKFVFQSVPNVEFVTLLLNEGQFSDPRICITSCILKHLKIYILISTIRYPFIHKHNYSII